MRRCKDRTSVFGRGNNSKRGTERFMRTRPVEEGLTHQSRRHALAGNDAPIALDEPTRSGRSLHRAATDLSDKKWTTHIVGLVVSVRMSAPQAAMNRAARPASTPISTPSSVLTDKSPRLETQGIHPLRIAARRTPASLPLAEQGRLRALSRMPDARAHRPSALATSGNWRPASRSAMGTSSANERSARQRNTFAP